MRTGRCAARVVVVLALAGVALGAGVVRKDLRFKVGKHPMVSVNNQYGPITVRAGAAHQVVVTAILHSDKVELDQSKSGNRIGLVSHLLPGADQTTGVVEYEIQVPADANVTLQSDTGPIHVEKLRGDVTIQGSNAPISVLDGADGHVHVKTLDGAVTLTNIRNGHVEVVSMGGDVTMNIRVDRCAGAFVQRSGAKRFFARSETHTLRGRGWECLPRHPGQGRFFGQPVFFQW